MAEIHALVVDNSPVIRKILSHVLEAEGCLVQVAEDGLDALDCIARQRPDIIFTDLIMPRIDGEKLCSIITDSSPPRFTGLGSLPCTSLLSMPVKRARNGADSIWSSCTVSQSG